MHPDNDVVCGPELEGRAYVTESVCIAVDDGRSRFSNNNGAAALPPRRDSTGPIAQQCCIGTPQIHN